MAFVVVWRPSGAGGFSPIGVGKDVSGFPLKSCPPGFSVFSVNVSVLSLTSGLCRLKRRPEFLRVQRQGRKWAAPGLVLQARDRREDEREAVGTGVRVGFTVSRKVGNAVQRNRARRRLRAAADIVFANHGRGGTDIVIIGRATTLKRPFVKLVDDLTKALQKLDAYDNG